MKVKCIKKEEYNNDITIGNTYDVIRNGINSWLIKDDVNEEYFVLKDNFIVLEETCCKINPKMLLSKEELHSKHYYDTGRNSAANIEGRKEYLKENGLSCQFLDSDNMFGNVTKAAKRKQAPIYSGVIKYFPNAIKAVAKCSFIGNEQHNPGTPLHWDRAKSGDELDACMRHLTDHATGDEMDDDGILHLTKVAWRALAMLEKTLEKQP